VRAANAPRAKLKDFIAIAFYWVNLNLRTWALLPDPSSDKRRGSISRARIGSTTNFHYKSFT
jgi:hypothetical protein